RGRRAHRLARRRARLELRGRRRGAVRRRRAALAERRERAGERGAAARRRGRRRAQDLVHARALRLRGRGGRRDGGRALLLVLVEDVRGLVVVVPVHVELAAVLALRLRGSGLRRLGGGADDAGRAGTRARGRGDR